jgi:hypothetical protein
MKRKAILAAMLAAIVTPAPSIAQTQGNYFVRNDTRAILSCGLRRAHGTMMDRFLIDPGAEWRSDRRGNAPRTLICEVGQILPHFRLRPGVRYVVADGNAGTIVLRVAGAGSN